MVPAVRVLATGRAVDLQVPWPLPLGSFAIAVDPLAAFFLVVIAVVTSLAALYGTGYLSPHEGERRLGVAWCLFHLLTASMFLIVLARNGLLFLLAWEGMSLASLFLVLFEHEAAQVREAGWTYAAAAHLGTACLLVFFLLMAGPGGDLDFAHMTAPRAPLSGALFVLAVAGFGAKAGFVPLHVWLPEAHPAAPSHVSAVMSGVMIKTGIYGLVRVLSLMGPPAPWWGWTLLGIGAASGILGVLSALAQHDLKRLLAYHSVENIGIICLGLGLWLLGTAAGDPRAAVLGLSGGLLHVCNHAVFKSLLFLGAGSVKHAAHSLVIDRLGGLGRRMPKTAAAFLIGSTAICGLPPLNGFVSEFLIYMGAFDAVGSGGRPGALSAAGLAVLLSLALIGGLAAACFAKVYGIVFLGEPRSPEALRASETSPAMHYPMAVLAGLCLALGLGAPLGMSGVGPVVGQLTGPSAAGAVRTSLWGPLGAVGLGGALIIAAAAAFAVFRNRLLRTRTVSHGPTWDCGYVDPTARMQYTASSFAWPILQMFRWVVQPRRHVRLDPGDFPRRGSLDTHTDDLFRRCLFEPIFRAVRAAACSLHGLQQGRNQTYVLYIAIVLLALLLVKVR
jgi:formate hydrogenlyase subunit 3/multisubunit Na+/H+ antiporter MnhD subunit